MTNMTLAIPDDLMEVIRKHKEIKWSEVARQALTDKANELKLMDQILYRSTLTERDAIEGKQRKKKLKNVSTRISAVPVPSQVRRLH